jgi:hypothetical protein
LEEPVCTLVLEATHSSEMLVNSYRTTWHHEPEDHNQEIFYDQCVEFLIYVILFHKHTGVLFVCGLFNDAVSSSEYIVLNK